MSLFVDTYDRLYCSVGGSHQVIRNSYLGNINQTETVAGSGTAGSAADMLDTPRGNLCGSEDELVRRRLPQ